jgi:DNA mismatch repair protein MutH
VSSDLVSYDRSDPRDIERHALRLVGRRLGELVDVAREERQGTHTKGRVGLSYERHFGLPPSSDAGPDLPEAGVELKSVPLRKLASGPYTAKERTFITAIDYGSIAHQGFEGSPLDLKTRRTLYIFYEWQDDVAIGDIHTLGALLHERDELDELMLREVHGHVRDRVRRGLAHELSEGDTWGVGAATKDTGGRWVDQPNSAERARRRAFAYKQPYTTRLWQLAKPRTSEGLPHVEVPDDLDSFRAEIIDRIHPWVGSSIRHLREHLAPHVSTRAKQLGSIVSRRLLGSEGRHDIEEFRRLGITVRAIRVDPASLLPHEDVSFRSFDPTDMVDQEWESSDLIDEVSSLFFVVFEAPKGSAVLDARLRTAFFWRPDREELAIMAREWERLRQAFAESRPEDRPQASRTRILHVRPKGRNARDTLPLPDGRPYVRSSFWLNREFVRALIAQHEGSS